MKIKLTHNIISIVLLMITAVVLCALPLKYFKQEKIYIYTKAKIPSSQENGFVQGLRKRGYKVIVNSENKISENDVSVWFSNIETIESKSKLPLKYCFLYVQDYFPLNLDLTKENPIILTPYQDIFEHYTRTNIRSATFYLGENEKVFSFSSKQDKKQITYYELRDKYTNLAQFAHNNEVNLLGSFWVNDNISMNATEEDIYEIYSKKLQESVITLVDNNHVNNLIPQEIIHATLSGSLVITPYNKAVYNMYQNNVVYYDTLENAKKLITEYKLNPKLRQSAIINAYKTTTNKLTSTQSVERFIELLNWLKNNY